MGSCGPDGRLSFWVGSCRCLIHLPILCPHKTPREPLSREQDSNLTCPECGGMLVTIARGSNPFLFLQNFNNDYASNGDIPRVKVAEL
jgi:hypothetical protein